MPDSTKRIDEMAEAARFYVYELIDPRDGKVFYIGKGRGGASMDMKPRRLNIPIILITKGKSNR